MAISRIFFGNRTAEPAVQYGVNMGHNSETFPRWLFQDAMKESKNFFGGSVPDANGYPTVGTTFQTQLYDGVGGHYPAGIYTVFFDGSGPITVAGDASASITVSGQTFTATPTDTGILLTIAVGTTNIRIARPGFALTYDTEIFDPDVIAFYQASGTAIRFMDPTPTNNSPHILWANRATTTRYTQNSASAAQLTATTRGMAYEYMIELCNQTECDMWICVPHRADDDYVTNLAAMLFADLDPGINVFVEYSNEIWNALFDRAPGEASASDAGQYTYCGNQGDLLALGGASTFHNRHRFQKRRSIEIFDIFEAEFGGTGRLRRVLAGALATTATYTEMLTFESGDNSKIDYIALTGYFGGLVVQGSSTLIHNPAVKPTTLDILFADLDIEHPISLGVLDTCLAVIDGLGDWVSDGKIAIYEGGAALAPSSAAGWAVDTNLQQLCNDALRDPRMYDLYIERVEERGLARGISVWMHYSDFYYPTTASTAGRWGLKEYSDQSEDEAQKYRAWIGLAAPDEDPGTPVAAVTSGNYRTGLFGLLH